ncbi:MAG TPA: hypothetical protein VKA21_02990, partial [Candidatus Binatia bacterium]|nr:hypothetical protein [Candidatus Binatia bacterium]
MKATRLSIVAATLLLATTGGPAWAQLHGAGILKSCEPCKIVGEMTNCLIQVQNIDGFQDTLTLKEGFDTVASGTGPVRVPLVSGNLPIVAVSGTTTCTVGGSLPCDIGPGAAVTFRSNQYVILATDPSSLSDTGRAVVQDKCNQPAGQGNCSTLDATLPFSATTQICQPDNNECTDDACIGANEASETCQHPAKADSTACTDSDGNSCTTAGCEAGNCTQTHNVTVCPPDSNECTDDLPCNPANGQCAHPPKSDSTTCTDSDGNACTQAGCEAGNCVQTHNTTVCTPDNNECTNEPPCDTATGACNHPPKTDSTTCTDSDGNACTTAGCEA